MTNIQYLNDSRELIYFYDDLTARRNLYFPTTGADDKDKYWIPNAGFDGFVPIKDKNFTGVFCDLLEKCHDSLLDSHVCVGSFSEEGDLLSQWRAYATNKAGVSISFNIETLVRAAETHGFIVRKCKYVEDSQPNYYVTRFIKDAQGMMEDFERFQTLYIQTACMFKHKTFNEEREWRIITRAIDISESQLRYRATTNNLVPYYEMSIRGLEKTLISEVKIGPSRHQDLVYESVKALCKKLDYSFSVSMSAIPFRADI